MGADYTFFQAYALESFDYGARSRLIMDIIASLTELDYVEAEAVDECERVIVVGPITATSWGLVFDSAAYRTDENLLYSPDANNELARALSRVHNPIVEVSMGDSFLLDLTLYVNGKMMDQYTNNVNFRHWETKLENQDWAGKPDLWAHYLNLDKSQQEELRTCWDQREIEHFRAEQILSETSSILEWDQQLSGLGYTWGMDGIPVSYRRTYHKRVNEFTELYFCRKPKQRRLATSRP